MSENGRISETKLYCINIKNKTPFEFKIKSFMIMQN